MNYQETVEYLYNSTPVFERVGAVAYKEGLENTHALDSHFGHPHQYYKTIHVAGTNGKGSCSHTLAAILQSAGYKVGLYTSPHLVDFRERIKVNGQEISKQRVIDFVEEHRAFFEPLHPSFFELTTALAFLYFKEQKVDVAVIEVGLGGRLDCTNIITPILSIITNISFDHTQFLGNTFADIAGEKAGIIKKGVPVVIGETMAETTPVFCKIAAKQNAPLIFAETEQEVAEWSIIKEGGMEYHTRHFGILHGELGGEYQAKNTNTVLTAVNVLHNTVPNLALTLKDVKHAFENVCEATGLQGRWQRLHNHPLVVCDTGHNVGGWNYLAHQIASQKCERKRIVFGMVDDKDINAVMNLLPKDATYYWTQANSKRAVPSEKVMHLGTQHQLRGTDCGNVENAYRKAIEDAGLDDFVFVGGSSYVVADLLSLKDF
jgi:dihydrofolate synthase / folylpolyglutamate synthase